MTSVLATIKRPPLTVPGMWPHGAARPPPVMSPLNDTARLTAIPAKSATPPQKSQ